MVTFAIAYFILCRKDNHFGKVILPKQWKLHQNLNKNELLLITKINKQNERTVMYEHLYILIFSNSHFHCLKRISGLLERARGFANRMGKLRVCSFSHPSCIE